MQEQQEQERAEAALRRTPSPEEHAQQQQHQGGRNAGTASLLVLSEADYSPIPGGADASSQSSPGSASDHMGLFPVGSSSGSLGGGGGGGAPMMYPGSAAIAAFDAGQQQRTNRFIPTNITTGTTTSVAAAVGSKFGVAGAIPTPVTSFSSDVAAKCSKSSGATTTGTTTVRRQKRLQRNRESARLSRRRRKQYLEELEERVEKISESLDQTRRKHVGEAVATIHQKRFEILAREGCLNDNNSNNNSATVSALLANLSRTSPELMIATTFQSQQLKSFSAPPDMQFMLWLTLQTEAFFRGGRAASERLSAARIGERVRFVFVEPKPAD